MKRNFHVRFLGGGEGSNTSPATRRESGNNSVVSLGGLNHERVKHRDIVARLNQIDQALRQQVKTMRAECDQASPGDCPFRLFIHVGAGCLSLRWRWRDYPRSPVEPCRSSDAQTALAQAAPPCIRSLLEHEARRIEINHQYSLLFHERKRLRMLVRKRRELKRLKNHFFY